MRVEQLQAARNAQSDEVARRKKARESADDLLLRAQGVRLNRSASSESDLKDVEALLDEHLLNVPNFLLPTVPDGEAAANRVARTWGDAARLRFRAASPTGTSGRRSACSICRAAPR